MPSSVVEEDDAITFDLRSSERFFFEPSGDTRCILKAAAPKKRQTEITAVEMESENPYVDFRTSMEEMVGLAYGSGEINWEFLEMLLDSYLSVNAGGMHDLILAAFVDLLLHLACSCSCSCFFLSKFAAAQQKRGD